MALTTQDIQFVTDSAGQRTAVLMPLDQHHSLNFWRNFGLLAK